METQEITDCGHCAVVHELLECPVCLDFLNFPIYQCCRGHTLCNSCKSRVRNRCPTCREPMDDIRCLVLEKIAESYLVHCKYEEHGCPRMISSFAESQHEDSCEFRPYDCPCAQPGCSPIRNITSLLSHLADYHKVPIIKNDLIEEEFTLVADLHEDQIHQWRPTVYKCYGEYFCVHFEACHLRSIPVYMAFLCMMGSQDDAQKYYCRLQTVVNGRKLSAEGIPGDLRGGRTKIIESGDGLIWMRSLAQPLEDGETSTTRSNIIIVRGRIWKKFLYTL